jgi:TonB family protein
MPLPADTTLNDRYTIRRTLDPGGEDEGDAGLAAGAFATVYLADDSDGDAAAILTEYVPAALSERTDDGELTPRDGREELFEQGMTLFRKETGMLREIDHPNLARPIDDFRARGTAFRAGAHPAGASLAGALQKNGGRIDEEAALEVMRPALGALHALHREGGVHAGFAPAAIYLTKERKVLLRGFRGVQFQLARRMVRREVPGAEEALAEATIPGISPPEQSDSEGRRGPWTDVYAAAATFFRAVTGRRLPEVSANAPSEQDASEEPGQAEIAEALAGAEELSEELKPVLGRALAPRPRGRLQSAQALLELLEDPSKLPEHSLSEGSRSEEPGAVESEDPEGAEGAGASAIAGAGASERDETRVEEAGEEDEGTWGPASIAAAAAEAARQEKEKARNQRKKREAEEGTRYEDDQPAARAGRRRGADDDEEDGDERLLPVSNRVAMGGGVAVLLVVAGLLFSSLLGGSTSNAEGSASARYERLVAEGDSLFEASAYRAAARRYREAEDLDIENAPGEGRVSERLLMIERLQEAVEGENYRRAMTRGDSLVARAERLADGENEFGESARLLFEQAREAYVAALSSRPDDSTALARVQSVRNTLDVGEEESGQQEDEETTLEEEQQLLFERYRDGGDEAFANENYEEARRQFNEALGYQPDNTYVQDKLEEIETRISEAQQQEQYRRYLRRADSLVEAGQLEAAKNEYQLALDVNPGDTAATRRLDEIAERQEQQRERQEQYQLHRSRGDMRFSESNFQQAAASYRKALDQRPDDDYVQRRLQEAEQRLAEAKQAAEDSANQQQTAEQQTAEQQTPDQQTAEQQTAEQQTADQQQAESQQAAGQQQQQTVQQGGGQEEPSELESKIYQVTDQQPKVVGGQSALYENISYPEEARQQGIEGRVFVRATIGKDGSVRNVKVQRGVGSGLDTEAARAVRNAEFEPAVVDGEPVAAYRTLMVRFQIE